MGLTFCFDHSMSSALPPDNYGQRSIGASASGKWREGKYDGPVWKITWPHFVAYLHAHQPGVTKPTSNARH